MSAAARHVRRDIDLLFLEWREDVAGVMHSLGVVHQLRQVTEEEWRAEFERGDYAADSVLRMAEAIE